MGSVVQERIGLYMDLKYIGLEVDEILLMEDDQEVQHLVEYNAVTQRSRQINTKYPWLYEKMAQHNIRIKCCPTSEMVAEYFTKPR
ncbi:hypothetical protein PF010_g4643 [Phytophthora fragariae]|uniref:Uncharacterized protein n=1 Tax=Phytophthora fragariae TaxID=53985 RepID=A0A6G0LRJ7_9STRA|nr:hypothetical protein PF010_g4643 [Phytophthora fragariae]KAE9247030.1 hypothetical protein PF004_g4516 [Phytophthora fragariae]